jgi:hypothetical protein
MPEEQVPVAIANAHASVDKQHVPTAIVHRSARARAEEIDEELLLAHDTVFSAMRPEASKLRIGPEPGQQIIRHRCDRVVPSKAIVKALRPVAQLDRCFTFLKRLLGDRRALVGKLPALLVLVHESYSCFR